METAMRRLVGATVVLVCLVQGVECWTNTYSYTAGGGAGLTLILLILRLVWCFCSSYDTGTSDRGTSDRGTSDRGTSDTEADRQELARQLALVSSCPQQNVDDTSSIPTNPYNTGYDHSGRSVTLGSPPPYDQPGRPTAPGNPHNQYAIPSYPYKSGYKMYDL